MGNWNLNIDFWYKFGPPTDRDSLYHLAGNKTTAQIAYYRLLKIKNWTVYIFRVKLRSWVYLAMSDSSLLKAECSINSNIILVDYILISFARWTTIFTFEHSRRFFGQNFYERVTKMIVHSVGKKELSFLKIHYSEDFWS